MFSALLHCTCTCCLCSAEAGKTYRNHQMHLQNVNPYQFRKPEQAVTGTLHPSPPVTVIVYKEHSKPFSEVESWYLRLCAQ